MAKEEGMGVRRDGNGQGKNSGSGTQGWPLNLEMDGVGCGEATHTHSRWDTPPSAFTYLASPWARVH